MKQTARQITESLRSKVIHGELIAGQRMPTVRQMATLQGVSSDTIFRAYKYLAETGLLDMKQGAHTSVANPLPGQAGALVLRRVIGDGPLNDYEALSESSNVRSFATNVADPRFFRDDEFLAEMRDVASRAPWGFYYAPPEGDLGLRHAIAEWLNRLGTPASADNIVVTLGSQQGLSMLGRYLMQPGDKVAIEGADHLGGDRRWAALGLERHVVPRLAEEEPDLNGLANVEAKVLVVSPTGCGASGRVMTPAKRKDLVSMAKETGITIVEDASNSAIVYGERPRDLIASGDGIIQVGSFANSLAPGVRLGYIAAEAHVCRDLAAIQQLETGGLGLPTQIAMASYMRKGMFQDQITRCTPRYRKRRDALMSAMAKHFPKGVTWSVPMAGFGCKVDLGHDFDQRAMYDRAVECGVAFTPGAMLFGESEQSRCIRVCFGNQTESRIDEGIRILGGLLTDL